MATKNKKKKKQPKKAASRKPAPKKKLAKKVPASKTASKKGAPKKSVATKKNVTKKSKPRGKSEGVETVVLEPKGKGARSGGQSGDLQGLSDREGADSESVDELLEEGNAFEAEVVKGIEDADDADEGEVRTHEVPEDDVPEEYLDKDQ